MSKRFAAATAVGVSLLTIAAPATAARQSPPPVGQLAAPKLTVPFRDAVLGKPNLVSARVSATAMARRYPVGDRKGRSVAIAVTAACRATCKAADPRQIAGFLGTVAHGNEISLLSVELNTPSQISAGCGGGTQACYFVGGNRMLINGNKTPAKDGASREFVLAHEYGHHLAQHRPAPRLYSPPIDWGTPRWAGYERICQGKRKRRYFPGNQRSRYFQNPGEAFAEAFAFNRFPRARVKWAWSASLKPDAGAFAAIRADVSSPWSGPGDAYFSRRIGRGRRSSHSFPTPIDGGVTLRLRGPRATQFELRLFDRAGRLLRTGRGRAILRYDVCGKTGLRAEVRRLARGPGRYRLAVRTP